MQGDSDGAVLTDYGKSQARRCRDALSQIPFDRSVAELTDQHISLKFFRHIHCPASKIDNVKGTTSIGPALWLQSAQKVTTLLLRASTSMLSTSLRTACASSSCLSDQHDEIPVSAAASQAQSREAGILPSLSGRIGKGPSFPWTASEKLTSDGYRA